MSPGILFHEIAYQGDFIGKERKDWKQKQPGHLTANLFSALTLPHFLHIFTFLHFLHFAPPHWYLFASSIPPHCLLGFRGELRRIRGGNEEAMRRIRGEIDVRPTFSRRSSHVLEGTVHIFQKKGEVGSRFVSSILARSQELRESEPGDLLPGSGRKKHFSLNF
jgi:hypothetical protein